LLMERREILLFSQMRLGPTVGVLFGLLGTFLLGALLHAADTSTQQRCIAPTEGLPTDWRRFNDFVDQSLQQLERHTGAPSSSSTRKSSAAAPLRTPLPTVAIVSFVSQASGTPAGGDVGAMPLPLDLYIRTATSSVNNHLAYSLRHPRFPYFFHNAELLDRRKQPHWSKIPVLWHYLNYYQWVMWTDIDVIIMYR
jgi:hypothetical protein